VAKLFDVIESILRREFRPSSYPSANSRRSSAIAASTSRPCASMMSRSSSGVRASSVDLAFGLTALRSKLRQESTGKLGPIRSLVVGQFVDPGHEVSIQPQRDPGPRGAIGGRS